MSRIIFINRFYAPDYSATSQILTSLAEYLASEKMDIHVVTSKQLYEDPKAQLLPSEVINNVYIHRIFSTKFGRVNLFGRGIDYASFYIFALFFLLKFICKSDVIVAKTDPPLISVIAAIVVKLKRATLINWIQDLFPEVMNAIHPNYISKPIFLLLKRLRNWSLMSAKCNVVIGELMRKKLNKNGIENSNIEVIHNWFVGENSCPPVSSINQLKLKWGLEGKCIIGYSGNLGRAHEYQTFLKAIELLKDNQNIMFLFIGGGVGMETLRNKVREKNFTNVVFKPYQAISKLGLTLRVPDVHFISLMPSLEGLVVPSKFYGVLAAGRPIIFVGSEDGELAKIIKDTKCGVNISINKSDLQADSITQFCLDSSFGENARKAFEKKFMFKYTSERWVSLLSSS